MATPWRVVRDEGGNPLRAGFCDFELSGGEVLEEHEDVQPEVLEAIRERDKSCRAEKEEAVAVFTPSVEKGSITHEELVQLLKLKGVI